MTTGPYTFYGQAVLKDGQLYTLCNTEQHARNMAEELNKKAFDERLQESGKELLDTLKKFIGDHGACYCTKCEAARALIERIEYPNMKPQ